MSVRVVVKILSECKHSDGVREVRIQDGRPFYTAGISSHSLMANRKRIGDAPDTYAVASLDAVPLGLVTLDVGTGDYASMYYSPPPENPLNDILVLLRETLAEVKTVTLGLERQVQVNKID